MREPWEDEQERQEQLEAHMSRFPVCNECGRSLINMDVCVRIKNDWYCEYCATVMTNDEMREEEGLDD